MYKLNNMDCKNCNAGCFPEPIGCYFHDGKSVGVVEQGDSQVIINEKLAKAIEDLDFKSSPSCSGNCTCGKYDITPMPSVTVTTFSSMVASVTTKPNSGGVQVSYKLKDAAQSIGTVSRSRVQIQSNNGTTRTISDSDLLDNTIVVRPDDFPAVINADIRVLTEDGEKSFTQTLSLDPEGKEEKFLLSSTSLVAEAQIQETINQSLNSRLSTVEGTTQGMSISDMQARISALESQIAILLTK